MKEAVMQDIGNNSLEVAIETLGNTTGCLGHHRYGTSQTCDTWMLLRGVGGNRMLKSQA